MSKLATTKISEKKNFTLLWPQIKIAQDTNNLTL